MPAFTHILKLSALWLIATATPIAAAFNGTGELHTLWSAGDHADLGCITDEGLWTARETACGAFEAVPVPDTSMYTLTTAAGACWVRGARFTCGEGNEAFNFGVIILFFSNWPNGIPGVKVLRYGQYGLMASRSNGPPGLTDSPKPIHLVSYSETGKYVWLTWKDL
ncbi:hypothetical protein B0T25DRAFT_461419 [Lasiosphaeria hispida]|uniref:RNase T2-like C-terminal domain-containing protein n=1 Tax=Lasiosphaeria hispida TaxID=260671 RepID=A0AAJ0HB62_9PEZI|nr:hypothetical protein B0T25DRAFT_461419 [Lasiosphaeria hispida]